MNKTLLKLLLGKALIRLAREYARDRDLPFDQAIGQAVAAIYQNHIEETLRRELGREPYDSERRAAGLGVQGVFEGLL